MTDTNRARTLMVAVVAATFTGFLCGQTASASDATSTLGVSVTVARSCSVSAHGVNATSANVALACSSGHVSRVMVGTVGTRGQLMPSRSAVQLRQVQDTADATSDGRVMLNF
jgi:hypothetical protein